MFKLRDYQEEAKKLIRQSWIKGLKSPLLCLPTGGGKTVTFADMAAEAVNNGKSVLVLVHRKELLEQAADKLTKYGLQCGIITGGKKKINRSRYKVFVATVQTLLRRDDLHVDLLVIDECHRQEFDKLLLSDAYKNVYKIGVSATPIRKGRNTQLSDLYTNIVETVTVQDLIEKGSLVPAITYGQKMDDSNFKTKNYDYDANDVYNAFNNQTLYDGVIEMYQKHGENRKAICFCVNREHSEKTSQAFNDAGIVSASLDSKVPKKQREMILKQFKQGIIQVLCNVEILTAGFDEWTIECVILNMKTKQVTKFLQACGRGSRITPSECVGVEGYLQKEDFIILDMGGNVQKLGLWEMDRKWSLDHKKGDALGVAPVKDCPTNKPDVNGKNGCDRIVRASAPTCPACGYIFPKKEKEVIKAELTEIKATDKLPKELQGKEIHEMNIFELEKVRIAYGYKLGWIVRRIYYRKDLSLIHYGEMRGFKNPSKWKQRMIKIYNL